MADPTSANAAANVLQGPLGPLLMLAIGPAIAAGWGADQAIVRAGGGREAVDQVVSARIAPIEAELAAIRSDLRELAREARRRDPDDTRAP